MSVSTIVKYKGLRLSILIGALICTEIVFAQDWGTSSPGKDGATGTVTLIQRFGSALNVNIHFHILFLDDVYVCRDDRPPRFQRVKARSEPPILTFAHLGTTRSNGSLWALSHLVPLSRAPPGLISTCTGVQVGMFYNTPVVKLGTHKIMNPESVSYCMKGSRALWEFYPDEDKRITPQKPIR